MVSRFESMFRDRVVPAAERAFGIPVDFILSDGNELQLTALVDITEIPATDETFMPVEGKLTIRTELLSAWLAETDVIPTVRVRDELYHVYSKSPPHCGLTVMNIRRKASEQDHTNMYDISDTQAVWHQA